MAVETELYGDTGAYASLGEKVHDARHHALYPARMRCRTPAPTAMPCTPTTRRPGLFAALA